MEHFSVETAEHGHRITRMHHVPFADAVGFASDLVQEKLAQGYKVVDRRPNLILLQSEHFKPYLIHIIKFVEVQV